jgi:hypothetical protein
METERITVDRAEAAELFRKYKEHQHYSTPVDLEIQRVYDAIQKGKMVVRALASIAAAGLGPDGLPKLAIVRADAEKCSLYMGSDGGARFSVNGYQPDRNHRCYIDMPAGTFADPGGRRFRHWESLVPIVPIHQRPKRGLANYHVLYEALWSRVVPVDPMLLRRVGQADLWIVLAAWDLTEVERAVLAGRING